MAFSYKAKILHTSARFPMVQHTEIYFPPPAKGWRSALSLQNGKRFACFPLRQHTRINFPSDKVCSFYPFSSFQRGKRVAFFPLISFRILALCKKFAAFGYLEVLGRFQVIPNPKIAPGLYKVVHPGMFCLGEPVARNV